MTAKRVHLVGASGAGTSTLGGALAKRLGCPYFDLVVFLAVPDAVRLERLRARERERYGAEAIAPGGASHEKCEAFMAWAASYETGPAVERSRAMHEAWLAALPCPVLRLEDTDDVETRLARVLAA